MPILAEQERLIASEQNLINDATQYANATNGSWVVIHDWGNITLGSAGIVLIKFDIALDITGGNSAVRIKVGSNYVFTAYTDVVSFQTFGTAIWLAAGTYDIKAEGYLNAFGSTRNLYLENFQCGLSAFNDQQGSAVHTYSSGTSFTVSNRTTPVGPLQQATYFVQVYAVTSGASTSLENIGDNFTNGVSILIDGAQVNWAERITEEGQGGTSGKVSLPYNVGSSHTVTISKRNGSTAVTITVIACPWILCQPSTPGIPVNIYFSQGSTVYCMLEPWFTNPTSKFVGVGGVHGVTFSQADDYYSSATGADLVNFSYMMDIVDILNNNLMAYGLGGCIGVVAVDAR
jgi:hypothetical protein